MSRRMSRRMSRHMSKRMQQRENHHGFVLLAVLVVVAAAILVATGGIFAARATTMNARAAASEQQLRDAALDGVAMAADRIASHRREILRGASPTLDTALFTRGEGLSRIEVTLEALASGEFFESESAKLDFNTASDAALDSLGGEASDEQALLADAMRAARPLASIDGAISLVGEADRARVLASLLGSLRNSNAPDGAASRDGATPALITLLTAHAREALIDNDGGPRLDLLNAFGAGENDEESQGAVASTRSLAALRAFDDTEITALEQAVKEAQDPADDSAIARELLSRGVSDTRVGEVLAACTLHVGELAPARLDVVRADERVLAAYEGLGADAASRIIDLRDTLDEKERQGVSWLLTRRVLTTEEFGMVAGRLTHRSTAWRIRVAARLVPDNSDALDAAELTTDSSKELARGPLALFDAIVDVSTTSPRLVYLRDVTLLDTARSLARVAAETSTSKSVEKDDPLLEAAQSSEFDDAQESQAATESLSTTMDFVPDLQPATLPNPLDAARTPTRSRSKATGRDVPGG